jgi:hypothetical protein
MFLKTIFAHIIGNSPLLHFHSFESFSFKSAGTIREHIIEAHFSALGVRDRRVFFF